MEEFHESEVLWPETLSSSSSIFSEETISNRPEKHIQAPRHGNESTPSSPIAIPCSSNLHLSRESREQRRNEDGCIELVPPHVLVSRRSNDGKMAFSLCSGQGRTLKGRDLRYIRNTVWRMTGFVDG